MGGGAAVLVGLATTFFPELVNARLVGLTAAACGGLAAYAIWAAERHERLVLEEQLQPRPFVTVDYKDNATEEERDLPETLTFKNIGHEAAIGLVVRTRPRQYAGKMPRLLWPVDELQPDNTDEKTVQHLPEMLRALYTSLGASRRVEAVRIPLEVHYSDLKGRQWMDERVVVYNGYGLWVEAITINGPQWTDLSGLVDA